MSYDFVGEDVDVNGNKSDILPPKDVSESDISNNELECILQFMKLVGEKGIAQFIYYQQRTIAGLQANNQTFVKAFHRMKANDDMTASGIFKE